MIKLSTFYLVIIFLLGNPVQAQKSYGLGDEVTALSFKQLLNYTQPNAPLADFKQPLIILDFFGTWCAPCVRALPKMNDLQQQFKQSILFLLVSTESSQKLQQFISSKQPFPFPVVVDQDQSIIAQFQPTAYPYTVVLNNARQIIAITDAGSINEQKIQEWLQQKNTTPPPSLSNNTTSPMPIPTKLTTTSANPLVALSQNFIYAAKTGDATNNLVKQLSDLSFTVLKDRLANDDEKKAFWINIYNGYTQLLLKQNPGAYQNRKSFFPKKQIPIAGKVFSLDDIEHGILRRSKIKWSLGYLGKWFPGKTEKALRVQQLDYRIHFALNCGAKSCPPIAFYDPATIGTQLAVATRAYLTGDASYDSSKQQLNLPALMGWFRRDFGGKKKMIALAQQLNIVPNDIHPKVHFNPYDWTLFLDHYSNN